MNIIQAGLIIIYYYYVLILKEIKINTFSWIPKNILGLRPYVYFELKENSALVLLLQSFP